jgi:hypothetical protein
LPYADLAEDEIMSSFRFTWGDTVQVSSTAPSQYRPGSLGSVCGMRIATGDNSASMETIEPTHLYLVEFGDGFTIEIPDLFLEA